LFSERNLINRIQRLSDHYPSQVIRGIGDDCAIISNDSRMQLISTDTLIENIHFNLSWHPPELLGRKAASVNLSDIAAMGGKPEYMLLSIALTEKITKGNFLDRFLDGFLAVLSEFQVSLIGGDTVSTMGPCMFSVTVMGKCEPGRQCCRGGAGAGDLIWVSGYLGEAAAGLALLQKQADAEAEERTVWEKLFKAHLDPVAQVKLGQLLAETGLVQAMIDLSDGPATDLAHICKESGTGAVLSAEQIPLSDTLLSASEYLGISPLELALTGGEDYQLLFVTRPEDGEKLAGIIAENLGIQCYCIGNISNKDGVFLAQNGQNKEIGYTGYEHK
jgi:thiamine-monophosphate kinase